MFVSLIPLIFWATTANMAAHIQGGYITTQVRRGPQADFDQPSLIRSLPDLFAQPELFDPNRYLFSEHGTKPGANDDGMRASIPFGSGRVSLYRSWRYFSLTMIRRDFVLG